MPDEPDLLSILQEPPQGPFAQAGSMLQGYAAGFRGQQNPAILQAQQEQRNRLAVAGVLQSIQRERRLQAESQREWGLGLLRIDNPAARTLGAGVVIKQLQQSGIPIPPGLGESLAAGSISLDKRKEAYLAILAGQESRTDPMKTDEYLVTSLGVPKNMLPMLRQEALSEPVHKMLFGQTLTQERLAIAKSERDERRYELQIAQGERRDRQLDLMTAREETRHREAQIRLDQAERRVITQEAMAELANRKFEYLQAHGPEEKRLKALDQAEALTNNMEATSRILATKGYLPPVGAPLMSEGYVKARGMRIMFPNDPDWVLWSKHLQPAMIGYARSVQNDIGPRAVMAFSAPLSFMDNPPDQASIQKVIDNMRRAIQLGREGKDTAQFVIIKHPNNQVVRVPWKRGMAYDPSDQVVGVE